MTTPDPTGPGAQRVVRHALVTREPADALAALLDIDLPEGDEVPELWHSLYLLEHPTTRSLGHDGHPTSGIPAPPAPGLRRMFAGGRVATRRRLRYGVPATRTTRVVKEVTKRGRTGALSFVTVRHEYHQDEHVAIVEDQDLVYRDPSGPPVAGDGEGDEPLPTGRDAQLSIDVDEPLLFRFSALTYNAHRIHYDREWCRREGYDDLVVHGPLQSLLMGELFRRNGIRLIERRFEYRLVSPMIGAQTIHVLAAAEGIQQGAEVRTDSGRQTAWGYLAPT